MRITQRSCSALSNTTIAGAKINRRAHKATFSFTGADATGFQCDLIKPKQKHRKQSKAAFSPCSSPVAYKHLRRGRYTFEVRGVNTGGSDPNPAVKKFKI